MHNYENQFLAPVRSTMIYQYVNSELKFHLNLIAKFHQTVDGITMSIVIVIVTIKSQFIHHYMNIRLTFIPTYN